jgi:hypothetical protein
VLIVQGGSSGGYSLYLRDRKLHYAYNYVGIKEFHIESDVAVADGRHELRFEFEPSGAPDLARGRGAPGHARLFVDGALVGGGELPVTIPIDIGITEGLTVGRDEGSAVSGDYEAPYAFTGGLEQVVVDVSGEFVEDHASQLRIAMAHQ